MTDLFSLYVVETVVLASVILVIRARSKHALALNFVPMTNILEKVLAMTNYARIPENVQMDKYAIIPVVTLRKNF